MIPFPQIRITLDSMKVQLQHAFFDKSKEWKEALSEQIDEAVKNYPIEAEVQRQVIEILREQIRLALQRAFADAFQDEAIKQAVRAMVTERLHEAFRGL
jgi:hypothetical protein